MLSVGGGLSGDGPWRMMDTLLPGITGCGNWNAIRSWRMKWERNEKREMDAHDNLASTARKDAIINNNNNK